MLAALALAAFAHQRYAAAIRVELGVYFSTWWTAFAEADTYGAALDAYNFRRPPGYPTLLFAAHHAGFPIRFVNEVLLAVSVVAFHSLARRTLRHVDAAFPTALYAVLACHYVCYGQLVDEALFVPLAILAMWALARDAEAPSIARAAEVGAWCSAACLVRTFALAWIVPVCGVALLVRGTARLPRRLLRAAVFSAIVVVPTALLMLYVRSRTGFLTGMDRTAYETRPPIRNLETFAAQTGPVESTLRIVQSYAVDFSSPRRTADLGTLAPPFTLRGQEVLFALLFVAGLAGLAACAVHGFRARRRDAAASREAQAPDASRSVASLTALAANVGLYFVAVVAIWTFGNNDPVYSRYVLPSYPFAILLATAIYDRSLAAGPPARWRMAVRGLYVLVFAAQAAKGWAALRST